MAKIFEVGDVLPAGKIKIFISHFNYGGFYDASTVVTFTTNNKITAYASEDDGADVTPYVSLHKTFVSTNYVIVDDTQSSFYPDDYAQIDMDAYIIIDFSKCTLLERTVSNVTPNVVPNGDENLDVFWETVSSEYPETQEILVRGDGSKFKRLNAYKVIEGVWHKMTGKAPKPEPEQITYLTFQSPNSFTLNTYNNSKNWDGTLYYSTDTTTWNEWSGTTTLSSVGNKLYLRGTGNTKITPSDPNFRWVLTGTNIECLGNIENLLDYETVLVGNSPAMASSCYNSMFSDCTSLTTAPALPATTLANYCYQNMFYGCTSLTTAPALPATTLARSCYQNMFRGCASLTTPPELPATTLASTCYHSMFWNCSSLTTAPSLPATILANYCYTSMFQSCTKIKVSATKTGIYQYEWRIPTTGTGTTATNWNSGMLSSTGGTFTSNPDINTTYYVEYAPV